MKRNFRNSFWAAALGLCSLGVSAQGLQGVVVEPYHTITAADAAYYNGLGNGSGTMTAGMNVYRVYIDMAPGYKLNTVFGSAANLLDITSTSVFWNDDGFSTQFPPQTSRHDDGAAFDSWITIGRASRSGGAAGCTTNLETLGVTRASDPDATTVNCTTLYSGFGAADKDGHVNGLSADPTLVGITAANLAPFIDVDGGSQFTTTGSWALLPPLDGPEAAGANRVLIGQFTTAGTFSFHINVSLQTPTQTVEFYTHNTSESGSIVSPFLTYPVACIPAQITNTTSNSPICSNETLNLGVTATGTEPISYTWTGVGTITNGNTANASVTGAATGNYNIAVSNACGNASQNVAVTVNQAVTFYADVDGDGFGDPNGETQVTCGGAPAGFVANNTDACPADPNKQAPGVCGCGTADVPTTYYADTDGDGFGDPNNSQPGFTCIVPPGFVANSTDECPTDPNKQVPGACGCGTADVPATYYADTDGDGQGDPNSPTPGFTCFVPPGFVANNTDQCPALPFLVPGNVCDDGNASTINDVVTANCQCVGELDSDGDGTPDTSDACPFLANLVPGNACDDGNAGTINDVVTANCVCIGEGDNDGDGVPNGTDPCPDLAFLVPGNVCDDANASTINDVVTANCQCVGELDSDGDGTPDATDACPFLANLVPGNACNDGNASTINDVVTANCVCIGDGDNDGDGVPNSTDPCPGLAFLLPGNVCDDANASTINDVVTANCQCVGELDSDGDGTADSSDACPLLPFLVPGSPCDDLNANTEFDMVNASCQCVGTPIGGGCAFNELQLEIEADGVSTTNYEVRQQGTNTVVASGGQLYSAGVHTASICLPDGCYYLVVTDDGGDGITGGGYILRTVAGKRIIDDRDNFTTGSVSQIVNNGGFCVPIGTDRLITASCDRLDLIRGASSTCSDKLTADLINGSGNIYQYWIYNPNGEESQIIPPSGVMGNSLALNLVSLPAGKLYNVRVRTRISAGVFREWGPACRMMISTDPGCRTTTLVDDTSSPNWSCGKTVVLPVGNQSNGAANRLAAQPAKRYNANCVPVNANKYQFRIKDTDTQVVTIVNGVGDTYFCYMRQPAFSTCKTYEVEVRVSFDNGTTWCNYGEVCEVYTAGCGSLQSMGGVEETAELRMYPNPNRGDQLTLGLEHIEEGVSTVSVDLYDSFGKRVSARTIAVQDGFINTVLDLNGDLSAGMYVVNITAGKQVFTERLVIQP